ncbi:hypothetical protein OPT61_g3116 [Boeremia exigua]|uniref:Uncharacterized protein n=1 Tax=Boeremia exigua TaxID=749465 RepID=A0ACC2IJ03_9PLEO|nr:hypothetical protein OPT61_g3116 [Boeremia exigua]
METGTSSDFPQYDAAMIEKSTKLEHDIIVLQDQLMRDENGERTLDYDFDKVVELMQNTLGPQGFHIYSDWSNQEFKRAQETYMEVPARPLEHYYLAVANTDLRNEKAFGRLGALFSHAPHPYIGIGNHKGYRYRLHPMTEVLEVDEDEVWYRDPVPFAPDPLVGIKINAPGGAQFSDPGVQSDFRKKRRNFFEFNTDESYSSTSSKESISVSADNEFGFAFLPLGRVFYISEHTVQAELSRNPQIEECGMYCQDSRFILGVTTVGPSGKHGQAGEVWLLQAFVCEDEIDNTEVIIEKDSPDWGWLKGDSCTFQRAGIKIADSFAQLQDGYEWVIEKYFESKYDVTKALLFTDDKKGKVIVRQDVGREKRQNLVLESGSRPSEDN